METNDYSTFAGRVAWAIKRVGGAVEMAKRLSIRRGQPVPSTSLQNYLTPLPGKQPIKRSIYATDMAVIAGVNAAWLIDGVGEQFTAATSMHDDLAAGIAIRLQHLVASGEATQERLQLLLSLVDNPELIDKIYDLTMAISKKL